MHRRSPAPLNVFVDGVLLLANVPFAGVSNYQTIPRARIRSRCSRPPRRARILISIDTSLTPASDTSIVVSGAAGALQALVLADNNLPAALGPRAHPLRQCVARPGRDRRLRQLRQAVHQRGSRTPRRPYTELVADATGNDELRVRLQPCRHVPPRPGRCRASSIIAGKTYTRVRRRPGGGAAGRGVQPMTDSVPAVAAASGAAV